jgi:type IV pilus assembly protein PilB
MDASRQRVRVYSSLPVSLPQLVLEAKERVPGGSDMVFTCNNCGSPLPVDDARIPKIAFRLRCGKCQNLIRIDPQKEGLGTASATASTPTAVPPPRPAANSAARIAVAQTVVTSPPPPRPPKPAIPQEKPVQVAATKTQVAPPKPVPTAPTREPIVPPIKPPQITAATLPVAPSVAVTAPPPEPVVPQEISAPPAEVKEEIPVPPVAPAARQRDGGAAVATTASATPSATVAVAEPEAAPVSAPVPSQYLQKIELFSQLTREECMMVDSRLKPREFAPQQAIVKEGGPGDSLFIIQEGSVEIHKKDPNTGINFLLTELKRGACFGEMALLTGKPRGATVVAIEPTTCGVLDVNTFNALLLAQPKIGIALSRVLAERLEEANQQSGIEYIQLNKLQFDARVLSLLPLQVIQEHKVLPVGYSNNRLSLAMVNPNNLIALDDVRRLIKGVMIEPVVTSEDDFRRFMTTKYVELFKEEEKKAQIKEQAAQSGAKSLAAAGDTAESVLESLQTEALKSLEVDESQQTTESVTDLSRSAEDAPIIRLANNVLALAIKKGASDIHIEPQEKDVSVRLRIDGALQQVQVLPKKIQMGLISRLKILSKLDIAEKRLPQDGRISVRMEERPIDFRVSTIPSKWGEKICMRILDKSNTLLGLDKMILHPDALQQVRDMIAQPYGIIYVTGPTGSGKTTTLYSALAELNDPDVNISTAEDPIEYDLARVNQVQAHKEIGLDFARILRAFLRQDPDIILVGETRDKETAHIAVEAALTGHLVFTTLHTNDAAGAFVRLNEMGVEQFLMSSSTVGVVAQRLTRRLCQKCKEPYTPDEISMKYMGLAYDHSAIFYKNKGCEKCSMTGFKGRVGVYEVLRMNSELRKLIAQGGKTEEITEVAVRHGMKTLKDYSVWLLNNGWTTMEEVLQVVAVQE